MNSLVIENFSQKSFHQQVHCSRIVSELKRSIKLSGAIQLDWFMIIYDMFGMNSDAFENRLGLNSRSFVCSKCGTWLWWYSCSSMEFTEYESAITFGLLWFDVGICVCSIDFKFSSVEQIQQLANYFHNELEWVGRRDSNWAVETIWISTRI